MDDTSDVTITKPVERYTNFLDWSGYTGYGSGSADGWYGGEYEKSFILMKMIITTSIIMLKVE